MCTCIEVRLLREASRESNVAGSGAASAAPPSLSRVGVASRESGHGK